MRDLMDGHTKPKLNMTYPQLITTAHSASGSTSIAETSRGENAASAGALTPHMLETLAARFRPAGLMLAIVGADGVVTYADTACGAFFLRYLAPALKLHAARAPAGGWVGSANGGLPEIPGAVLAGFAAPMRQPSGSVVLLAARADGFDLDEDVLRACGRLGLDARWVGALADQVPGYTPSAVARQSALLQASLGDLLKTQGLGAELDSLSQQLTDTYEELSLIYQLSGGMKVNRRPADFFKQVCLDVMGVANTRGMGVALAIDVRDCPPPAVYGRAALASDQAARLADAIMPILRQRKSPLLIDSVAADPNFNWLGKQVNQLLAVPLMRQDQVLGCLFALDKEDGDFDSVDSKLLTSIADESAVYLENATLFDDLHGLMMGLLHSLTSAVDAKDSYTCGHSERVALLSRHLAQQAGLDDDDVDQVYMAGLLHDVGKIGVPEIVLQKAGRLTAEEFDHMKRHPEIGARILADVKQLKPILPGVLHHHERWDGKGYPHALAGEKIPLMGRIICLADCFDAMTSNRTYRKALPVEVALCEIRRCSGTQFDPILAEAFLRTPADAFRELLRDHKDRSKRLIDMQETLRTK